jgi:NAD-dependent deacetylase
MGETLQRVRDGEDDPHCLVCARRGDVGVLKSDTVSFGQALVPEVIDAAMAAADECDVLLAAGSSLSVFPAANVVPRAKAGGARVVIVNAEPTGMDRFADVLILGSLGELLPGLIR